MQSVSHWMHNTESLPVGVDIPPRGRFRGARY
ncbi:hypothetical protein P3T25_003834 [Paraburkholderia sp. GAS32]